MNELGVSIICMLSLFILFRMIGPVCVCVCVCGWSGYHSSDNHVPVFVFRYDTRICFLFKVMAAELESLVF